MHPLLDAKKYTDDQITEKLTKCYSYLGMQSALGHDSAVASIQATILTLEEEKLNRIQNSVNEEHVKQDPDYLEPINIGFTEEIQEYKDGNQ